jgi:transcriptional regulator with XRE-family HTH domain
MPSTVAELCESQKINLAQLVERSGVDESRLTAIIMGRWTPSPAERQKVAAVFGVSIEDISWGHKTPIQHLWGHGPGGRMNGP